MFDPWVRKIPWKRKWQPTPVFLPGKSHGQWSLVGYSQWSCKESDTIERLHFHSLLPMQVPHQRAGIWHLYRSLQGPWPFLVLGTQ